ncbi:MAG: Flagellar protein FliO [Betaproteobacteria bacterium ADurb.Bin341]|nr:MAG: Flagellar protein FliO [Betaproteobacteria bacterium ADurb.Bin341]
MPLRPLLLIPCLCLLIPTAIAAGENTAPGVSSGSFIQAFLGLLVIVALLAGTAWFARKFTGGRGFGQGGMRIIGGVTLGPRERIVLVEVGNDWLVIGIVPGQIRKLHTLPKGEIADQPPLHLAGKPFAQWLRNVSERRNQSHAP